MSDELEQFLFDPDAELPISIDWSEWLDQYGGTIASSTWDADPGVVIGTVERAPSVNVAGTITTVWVTVSSSARRRYRVTNHVTNNTSPSKSDDRSFELLVRQR